MACFDFLAKRATVTIRIEHANDAGNSRLDGPARGSPEAVIEPIVAP